MTDTIRLAQPADAAGITRVHVDTWRTAYTGIIAADYLAKLSYEAREQLWTQVLSNAERKGFTYVAEDESGHIIGFVDGGPERDGTPNYQSELYALYLLQEYQKRGIGRRLVLKLAERFVQSGMTSMLLWVLADNPTRRFYEALGGQYLKTKTFELGGQLLDEVSYGWSDLRILLNGKDQHYL